jgi:hypothetical protein
MIYQGDTQLGANFGAFGQKLKGSSITTPIYASPTSDVLSGMESLVNNYNQAYGEAKSANEARYQQMLNIANQTTNQQAADITSSYGQQSSNAMQQLARLGMGNTTVAPTMQMGFEREKQAALSRNADQMQQTKLGIMERRKDAYPDLSALQSTIAGVGSQYGGGTGLSAMLQALGNVNY